MKVLSAEENLGSATNVGKAPVVRVYNSDSSAIVLTRKNNVETTLGSYTIPPGKVIYCQKEYTDTLEGGAALKATAIGYSEMLDIISVGGAAYSDGDIVTANLIYHLDANNSNSYEDGDGNTWTDLVAGTNNATISGATHTEGTGNEGFYFDFDGDDFVNFAAGAFSLGNIWTVEIWAKNDSSTLLDSETVFATKGNTGLASDDAYCIKHKNILSPAGFGQYSNNYNPAPSVQTWHQYVLVSEWVVNKYQARVYIDGTLCATVNNIDGNTSNIDPAIGRRSNSGGFTEYWNGQVSIFRAYSEVLTTTQIETNYNANKGRYGLS